MKHTQYVPRRANKNYPIRNSSHQHAFLAPLSQL